MDDLVETSKIKFNCALMYLCGSSCKFYRILVSVEYFFFDIIFGAQKGIILPLKFAEKDYARN